MVVVVFMPAPQVILLACQCSIFYIYMTRKVMDDIYLHFMLGMTLHGHINLGAETFTFFVCLFSWGF